MDGKADMSSWKSWPINSLFTMDINTCHPVTLPPGVQLPQVKLTVTADFSALKTKYPMDHTMIQQKIVLLSKR